MKQLASGATGLLVSILLCSAAITTGSGEASAGDTTCARWDLSGEWTFFQSNETSPVFRLEVTNTGLQGSAKYWYLVDGDCPFYAPACGQDAASTSGSVDGAINGNSFEIDAYWDNGTIGVYSGKIGPQGRLEGTTFDRQHPQTMANWYSDRTAKCLDDRSGDAGQVGTTSSALKTTPGADPVSRASRGIRVASATAPSRAIPVCDAAKAARADNSPAAVTLEAICRGRQEARTQAHPEIGSVLEGPRLAPDGKPIAKNATDETSALTRTRTRIQLPTATSPAATRSSTSTAVAAAGNAINSRPLGIAALRRDERFGTVAAPGIAVEVFQPANTIRVRVMYRKAFGYMTESGPFGAIGPSSCNAFAVSAIGGGGSVRQRDPIPIATDFRMVSSGDYYFCNFLISELPLNQEVGVRVVLSGVDLMAPWKNGAEAQPPAGKERAVLEPNKIATLTVAQPRARLTFEMVYAPVTGR